jgi:hypothetical protein
MTELLVQTGCFDVLPIFSRRHSAGSAFPAETFLLCGTMAARTSGAFSPHANPQLQRFAGAVAY